MVKPRRQRARFRVEDHAQLEALAFPARAEIVSLVAAHGPMTVAEMAQQLERQRPAVHYQVNILKEVDLLEEAGTRGTGREVQTVYRTPGRSMELVFNKHDPAVVELTVSHVKHLLQRAARTISQAFRSPAVEASGAARNTHLMTSLCRLDPERLAEVNRHIDALRDLCAAETLDSDGQLMLVTLALSPARPASS